MLAGRLALQEHTFFWMDPHSRYFLVRMPSLKSEFCRSASKVKSTHIQKSVITIQFEVFASRKQTVTLDFLIILRTAPLFSSQIHAASHGFGWLSSETCKRASFYEISFEIQLNELNQLLQNFESIIWTSNQRKNQKSHNFVKRFSTNILGYRVHARLLNTFLRLCSELVCKNFLTWGGFSVWASRIILLIRQTNSASWPCSTVVFFRWGTRNSYSRDLGAVDFAFPLFRPESNKTTTSYFWCIGTKSFAVALFANCIVGIYTFMQELLEKATAKGNRLPLTWTWISRRAKPHSRDRFCCSREMICISAFSATLWVTTD